MSVYHIASKRWQCTSFCTSTHRSSAPVAGGTILYAGSGSRSRYRRKALTSPSKHSRSYLSLGFSVYLESSMHLPTHLFAGTSIFSLCGSSFGSVILVCGSGQHQIWQLGGCNKVLSAHLHPVPGRSRRTEILHPGWLLTRDDLQVQGRSVCFSSGKCYFALLFLAHSSAHQGLAGTHPC